MTCRQRWRCSRATTSAWSCSSATTGDSDCRCGAANPCQIPPTVSYLPRRMELPDESRPATRVALITLGCDKNTVDSERYLAAVVAQGGRPVESLEDADVILVNTCGFIDAAKRESID